MKKTTLLLLFVLPISVVLAFSMALITFRGSFAATPAPESKSQEVIPDQQNTPDGIIEGHNTPVSTRLGSFPKVNPNIQTSESFTQDTFYSLANSYIMQDSPAQNFGHDFDMSVGAWEGEGITRSLIFFHIASLPSNQNILGATLRIYHINWPVGSDTPQKITTYRIPSNWVEGTVTWNNKPEYGESYGSLSIHGNVYGWYEFDVTNLVRGRYDGTYPNYGIMLRGVESDGIDASFRAFTTRESEFDPELIIQYEPNPSAPTISGLPDQELLVDTNLNNAIDLWAYTNDAEDADAALSFAINNSPNSSAGVSIDSNRYIDILPASGWTGVTNVEIEVTDTDGLSDTDIFQVEVIGEPQPSPPTIAGLPDQELLVDMNLNNAIDLWVYASDAEDVDAALSFNISNSPNSSAGVSIDSNRYIDINPSSAWTGVTNVEIEVTDTDGLSNTDIFQVEVIGEPQPSPPTIAGLPDQELLVDMNLNNAIDLWVYASDAEDADAALSFNISNSPNSSAGVSIDSNRYIDINPSSAWTGVTNVEIEVTDTDGLSDTDSFQVEVTSEASPSPTIAGLPDQDLLVDTSLDNAIDLWAYTNDFQDADADLSFTINNNPNPSAGVSIDSNRYIDINPASGWTGITNVAIEVMDTDGYSDLDSFQVRVFGEIKIINLPIVQKNSTFGSTSQPSLATIPQ